MPIDHLRSRSWIAAGATAWLLFLLIGLRAQYVDGLSDFVVATLPAEVWEGRFHGWGDVYSHTIAYYAQGRFSVLVVEPWIWFAGWLASLAALMATLAICPSFRSERLRRWLAWIGMAVLVLTYRGIILMRVQDLGTVSGTFLVLVLCSIPLFMGTRPPDQMSRESNDHS